MAVGMLMTGKDVTEDLYVALTEKMFGNYPMRSDQSPEGLIVHTAGETDDGFYVYDVWESQDDFERFVNEKLMPAARAISGGKTPAFKPEFNTVETVVLGS